MPKSLIDLSPREFENLTYDLLRLTGFENLTWRTPGSDEGRDIEGVYFSTDASGQRESQKWYVECKRYETSIAWPLIWEKLSYADVRAADFLLVATTTNPSPQCENQIAEWNRTSRTPKIRVWRGYELEHVIQLHGVVSLKYGLREPQSNFEYDFGTLSELLTKTVQAAYVGNALGIASDRALEASAALSELLTLRMHQAARLGRFSPIADKLDSEFYPWLIAAGSFVEFDTISLRAAFAYLRFTTNWVSINVDSAPGQVTARSASPGARVSESSWRAIRSMEPWLLVQLSLNDDNDEIVILPIRE